ncbi:tripartite tricarboxylate transporter substrate binding protein [Acuticoccus sp. M5D2P5]|uniref:tripartite tricarboxylate transporter substrate binding protein n=1 Tax=Acuticoccus kalidii TaxID=2910977 RepID=UPI001F21D4C2|nr:tripartite tricarboxylate transporter substrate binding protein [Acuticoccus kalidii]MCF3936170.1 tripartite tricarboxylate transporter substrate binding protein [Acuticoccus kalidii]
MPFVSKFHALAVAAGALSIAAPIGAFAQTDYPTKPIEIIAPAAPGGDTDFNARTMSHYLQEELGVSLPVINVPGAGGSLGGRRVLSAEPDGYTTLFYHGAVQVGSASGMTEFTWKDFELGAIAGQETGTVLVVQADAPWQTLDELMEDAKANPGSIDLTANIGATTYLIAKQLEAAGAQFNLVDVGGASGRLTAVLGGNVDVSQNPYAQVRDYLETGELRALATLTDEPIEPLADVPTARSQGYEVGFQYNYFFLFPKDTPQEVVEKFGAAVEAVVQNPDYVDAIQKQYAQDAMALTGEAAAARLEELDAIIGQVDLK